MSLHIQKTCVLRTFKAQHFWMLRTSENVAHYMKLLYVIKKKKGVSPDNSEDKMVFSMAWE